MALVKGAALLAAGLFVVLLAAGVSAALTNMLYEQATDRTGEMENEATLAVPAGHMIEDRYAGRPGPNLGPGLDFRAAFEVRLKGPSDTGPVQQRYDVFDNHVRSRGWQPTESEDLPGALVGYYEKGGLLLDLSVIRASPSWVLVVTERRPFWERNGPEIVGAVIGGLLAGWSLLQWRRRERERGPGPILR